jgi:kinesin family protein 2/24
MQLLQRVAEPPKIRVVVRKRPLNNKEGQAQDVVEILDGKCLAVGEMKTKVDLTKFIEEHYFQFDNVFESDQDNKTIYE